VQSVTTDQYYASAEESIASRPHCSTLSLAKLKEAGFNMPDWQDQLQEYVQKL